MHKYNLLIGYFNKQVTSETSHVLQSFGIKCEYRGQTNVKGTGNIPTYFVNINNDLEFETHLHMIRDLESLLKAKS